MKLSVKVYVSLSHRYSQSSSLIVALMIVTYQQQINEQDMSMVFAIWRIDLHDMGKSAHSLILPHLNNEKSNCQE